MNKEVGGVVLGFAGFVFLTMAFKGTYGKVWAALIGKPSSHTTATNAAVTVPIGGVTVSGQGGGAGSGRPGATPAPSGNPFQGALA